MGELIRKKIFLGPGKITGFLCKKSLDLAHERKRHADFIDNNGQPRQENGKELPIFSCHVCKHFRHVQFEQRVVMIQRHDVLSHLEASDKVIERKSFPHNIGNVQQHLERFFCEVTDKCAFMETLSQFGDVGGKELVFCLVVGIFNV
jgi:hypothetical protein